MSEATASGHSYDDVVGVRYEFPRRYRTIVVPGEPFVYYQGQRRADGRRGSCEYIGTGIVGAITPSRTPGRLVCSVEDWHRFATPLPFRDATDRYYEPGAESGGRYWQPGVRQISDDVYAAIVRDAAAQAPVPISAPPARPERRYPDPEIAKAVDSYAIEAAVVEARKLWPGQAIQVMPHNNPGFDLLVGDNSAPRRFVEVKGTLAPIPRFFISEGERDFSHRFADRYTLLVVHAIDLRDRTHLVYQWHGAVTDPPFNLQVRQWHGEIRTWP